MPTFSLSGTGRLVPATATRAGDEAIDAHAFQADLRAQVVAAAAAGPAGAAPGIRIDEPDVDVPSRAWRLEAQVDGVDAAAAESAFVTGVEAAFAAHGWSIDEVVIGVDRVPAG